MNGNNFESMIKKYTDELIKMSKEKLLPDIPEENNDTEERMNETYEMTEEREFFPFEEKKEKNRPTTTAIPGIETTDFFEETVPEETDAATDYATFSARVFTGNNAFPIKNAKVLVIKDDVLYTFLTTDSDGVTKKIRLPSFPEINSLNPESDERSLAYTGEVYATGFTPKKDLLISAVGGSDIILDVQMTPVDERVK